MTDGSVDSVERADGSEEMAGVFVEMDSELEQVVVGSAEAATAIAVDLGRTVVDIEVAVVAPVAFAAFVVMVARIHILAVVPHPDSISAYHELVK